MTSVYKGGLKNNIMKVKIETAYLLVWVRAARTAPAPHAPTPTPAKRRRR